MALLQRASPTEYSWERAFEEPLETLGSSTVARLLAVTIFLSGVGFAIFTIKDIHRFIMLLVQSSVKRAVVERGGKLPDADDAFLLRKAQSSDETDVAKTTDAASTVSDEGGESKQWTAIAVVGLTAYRFYTGFLSATWLPYLLAMEGEELWREKQSLFMGLAKLIYGATILLNPVFGLVGDQAVTLSHGVGRRLFVRIGITTAAIGIYICVLAARGRDFLSFLSGILVWRLGEAMNDVTTEALVPEMVPQHQYQMASGIKACSFLLGGLFGYALLEIYADAHYSWLYYAYPIGMFFCAMPSLMLLDKDHPASQKHQQDPSERESFAQSLTKAYLVPARYRGGFPRACLAVFIFSLGTAPMFFLLLIVRDLVGITNPVVMQQHFSMGSIVFFCAAAIASVLVAVMDPRKKRQRGPAASPPATLASAANGSPAASGSEDMATTAEVLDQRGRVLVAAMCSFGVIVLFMPLLSCFPDLHSRGRAYYTVAALFGASFGTSFSLFQDLTWQILPPEVNFANAMGFNVMSRLLGVGLGNFLCGVMLDMAADEVDGHAGYKVSGYVLMCFFSGFCVLASSAVASSAIEQAKVVDLQGAPMQVAAAA